MSPGPRNGYLCLSDCAFFLTERGQTVQKYVNEEKYTCNTFHIIHKAPLHEVLINYPINIFFLTQNSGCRVQDAQGYSFI